MADVAVPFPFELNGYTVTGLYRAADGFSFPSIKAWVDQPCADAEFEIAFPGAPRKERHGSVLVSYGYLNGPFVRARKLALYDPVHGTGELAAVVVPDDRPQDAGFGATPWDSIHSALLTVDRFQTFPNPEEMLRDLWLTNRRDTDR